MQVKKPIRRRNPRPEKGANATSKDGAGLNKSTNISGQNSEKGTKITVDENSGDKRGSGSRYAILENQENISMPQNMVNSDDCVIIGDKDLESANFNTVDLGVNTQPIPDIVEQNLSFKVGNVSSPHQESNNSKTVSKTYQEKRKPTNQGLSRVLQKLT